MTRGRADVKLTSTKCHHVYFLNMFIQRVRVCKFLAPPRAIIYLISILCSVSKLLNHVWIMIGLWLKLWFYVCTTIELRLWLWLCTCKNIHFTFSYVVVTIVLWLNYDWSYDWKFEFYVITCPASYMWLKQYVECW